MYKEVGKITSVKYEKYCDVCGAKIEIGMACTAAKCMYCERDLCENCIGNEEHSSGDYRDVWCKSCWDTGEEQRKEMEKLEKEIETLQQDWQNKALNKINKSIKVEVNGIINKERTDIIKGKEVRIIESLTIDSVSFVENKEIFDNSMETE